MPITTSLTGDRQRTKETFNNLFPRQSPEKVAKAAGAIDGSEVSFSGPTPSVLMVNVRHPKLEATRIFQKLNVGGKPHLFVDHSSLWTAPELHGGGYKRFHDVIGHLRDLGVKSISISSAAGSKGAADNGFYTWPRLGFNASLSKEHFAGLPKEFQQEMAKTGEFTFHKLFSLPGGPEFWKEHGGEIDNMHFDLDPNSEHSKRFSEYHARRERESAAGVRGVGGEGGTGSTGQNGSGPSGSGSTSHSPQVAGLQRLARALAGLREKKSYSKSSGVLKFSHSPLQATSAMTPNHSESGGQLPHHPLVKGTHLAVLLSKLADHPESTETVKGLAKSVLHAGEVDALPPLYDAAQDQDHPLLPSMGGYRWNEAAHKLLLDSALAPALKAITESHQDAGVENPEYNADLYLRAANRKQPLRAQTRNLDAEDLAKEAIEILHGIGHSPEDIEKSLDRHGQRRSANKQQPTEVEKKALAPQPDNENPYDVAARFARTVKLPVHPILRGTRLAVVLNGLLHTGNATTKALVTDALHHGQTHSLLALADHLQTDPTEGGNSDNPLADRAGELARAANKLMLDQHVHGLALAKSVDGPFGIPENDWEQHNTTKVAAGYLLEALHPDQEQRPYYDPYNTQAFVSTVREKFPNATEQDIRGSLLRLRTKSEDYMRTHTNPSWGHDFPPYYESNKQARNAAALGKGEFGDMDQPHTPEQKAANRFEFARKPDGLPDLNWGFQPRHAVPHEALEKWIGERWNRKLGSNKVVYRDGKDFHVTLHGKRILTSHPDGHFTLYRSDWNTPTTRRTLSAFTGLGVNSKAGKIHIDGKPLEDGMKVKGKESEKEEQVKGEKKEVEKFYRTPNPRRSNFLSALKRVKSSQQKSLRELAKHLFEKSGLTPVRVKDAIHSLRDLATASTVQAVFHDNDPDLVRKTASEYGLATNSPGMMLFHVDGQGPDAVHKLSVRGSGESLLKQLDKAGFSQRTLVPTKTGWEVFLVDRGSKQTDQVKQFASQVGSPLATEKGTAEVLGSSPDSVADSDTRGQYRDQLRSNNGPN